MCQTKTGEAYTFMYTKLILKCNTENRKENDMCKNFNAFKWLQADEDKF